MPLNQNILPIYWHLDSVLSLYPLPDLVIIGDPSKPFETSHQGCAVVNIVSRFFRLNFIRVCYKN